MPDELQGMWKELRSLRARIAHLEAVGGYGGPVGDADTVDGFHAADLMRFYDAYVCVRDKKTQGTHGGTFDSGAWRTRDINDEQADAAGICSVGANRITLQAGTYRCLISAPAWCVNRHQSRLYNITDNVMLLAGTIETAYKDAADASGYMTRSFIVGRFTVAKATVLEVQHRCSELQNNYGFGAAGNWTDEIYTVAEFWRES